MKQGVQTIVRWEEPCCLSALNIHAIGIVDFAREPHGAQLGMINVSDNDGRLRVVPILSVR